LLDRIDRADDKRVARAVAFDLECLGGLDAHGDLVNAFWENASPEPRTSVRAWYRRNEIRACLERAFFAETGPDWQRRISDAVEAVRRWETIPDPRDTPPA
jgi:hypothetical protein